jgi:[ribosomal protein S18]-alanine N-acetyltransferase
LKSLRSILPDATIMLTLTSEQVLSFYIRDMTRQDLADVTEIDREAFSTQWPPADYSYEFKNQMAHYMVACDSSIRVEIKSSAPGGFKAWLGQLFGRSKSPPEQVQTKHYIVGFLGFWIMAGEAHITSIAVRQKYRRHGIGEMLLIAAIDQAIALHADFATLEVRVSNTGAQALYLKHGFEHVGERKRYYLDRGPDGETREDALIMTTKDIKSLDFQNRLHRLKQLHTIK